MEIRAFEPVEASVDASAVIVMGATKGSALLRNLLLRIDVDLLRERLTKGLRSGQRAKPAAMLIQARFSIARSLPKPEQRLAPPVESSGS